jgi:hypothetical protein
MNYADNSRQLLRQLISQSGTAVHAFSYEKITVDGTTKNLTVPSGAKYALCVFESDATGIAARYLETKQTTINTSTGLALSNLDRFDITDAQNLSQFQITQAQAGTHVLHVQYYK